MSPKGPNLILSSDIPDVELDILVGDGLDIESDWDASAGRETGQGVDNAPVGMVVTD